MRLVLACLLLAACGSSSTPAKADATKMDSTGSGSGSACTGAVYDPCTAGSNSQCMSMMCHAYTMSGFTVCTTTCTPGDNTTCPVDISGNHGTCNSMANCKPTAPN